MYIYYWMWGLIRRQSGDCNITSAEVNGLGPFTYVQLQYATMRWRDSDEFAIKDEFLQ